MRATIASVIADSREREIFVSREVKLEEGERENFRGFRSPLKLLETLESSRKTRRRGGRSTRWNHAIPLAW